MQLPERPWRDKRSQWFDLAGYEVLNSHRWTRITGSWPWPELGAHSARAACRGGAMATTRSATPGRTDLEQAVPGAARQVGALDILVSQAGRSDHPA